MKLNKNWALIALAGAALTAATCISCGPKADPNAGASTSTGGTPTTAPSNLTGSVDIDGSSTVYPIVSMMTEDFQKANSGVKATATKSGTGSGFKKFAEGNLDICVASRTIDDKEEAALKEKGIEYIEVPIAFDGVSVVVNPANEAVSDLTVEELKKAWAPGSTVTKWSDIRAGLPDDKITFYGPTDNHGTYEYFTEKINGEKNQIRKEYTPNQEYSSIVSAVESDKNGFGYMGYSYYIEGKDKLKAVKVGGVEATPETIENGTYKPLSRVLFMYVSKAAYDKKPELKAFVNYALGEGTGAVEESGYVKLPADAYKLILERVSAGKVGSIFATAESGKPILDILNAAK